MTEPPATAVELDAANPLGVSAVRGWFLTRDLAPRCPSCGYVEGS